MGILVPADFDLRTIENGDEREVVRRLVDGLNAAGYKVERVELIERMKLMLCFYMKNWELCISKSRDIAFMCRVENGMACKAR